MSSSTTAPAAQKSSTASWRVVDIVVCAVIAVAVGLLFRLWAALWPGFELLFATTFPPAVGLLGGMWVIAGPLAALIIRKPGAALFCELLAAVFEAVLGSHFGPTVILSGFLQGLGAEIVFAILRYRVFTLWSAVLAGGLAAVFMGVHECIIYFAEWPLMYQFAYTGTAVISAAVLAGLVPWLLTRLLASTGALSAFASGSTGREV